MKENSPAVRSSLADKLSKRLHGGIEQILWSTTEVKQSLRLQVDAQVPVKS